MKILIVYDTKYGSTLEAATLIATVLKNTSLVAVDKFNEQDKNCDAVILGGHVYKGFVNAKLVNFVKEQEDWLRTKKLYSYVMMLEGDWGAKYLLPIKEVLGDDLLSMQSFGGRLTVNNLDKQDLTDIKKMMVDLHMPLHDINMFQKESIESYARDLKINLEEERNALTDEMIFSLTERYLSKQQSGIFAACEGDELYQKYVNYIYYQHYIYLTESNLTPYSLNVDQKISLLVLNEDNQFALNSDILISGEVCQVEAQNNSVLYQIKIIELKLEESENNLIRCIKFSYY